MNVDLRRQVLRELGAEARLVDELLDYNRNHFQHQTGGGEPAALPLPDEESVAEWREYAQAAASASTDRAEAPPGVAAVLKAQLPQLNFPIRAGMSDDPEYRRATRSGAPFEAMTSATGLELRKPEALEVCIYPTLAGHIPILIARERTDFESLLRAFLFRNEPAIVPPSMGAAMIAGFNNWGRVKKLRIAFEKAWPDKAAEDWPAELARIKPQRHLYQDRFILVSDDPYSGVSQEKRELGLIIRFEHEAMHYVTRRLLGSMKNNLLDELIADYAGIVAAADGFRADWFLRFMGLEGFPEYRPGGRFENYLADPPVSPDAVPFLRTLLVKAVGNLAAFDAAHRERLRSPQCRALMPLALTRLTLEELASDVSAALLEDALASVFRDFRLAEDWRENGATNEAPATGKQATAARALSPEPAPHHRAG